MYKVFTKKLRKELYHDEEEFVIDDGFHAIGVRAFEYCENLKKIHIPSSVKLIRQMAFMGCSSLERVEFEAESDLSEIEDLAFFVCGKLDNVKLPNRLLAIGTEAFERCVNLSSIDIPESVRSIGDFAFNDCNALRKIDLSRNKQLKKIRYGTFSSCSGLEEVRLPMSVDVIEELAFSLNNKLRVIRIPNLRACRIEPGALDYEWELHRVNR